MTSMTAPATSRRRWRKVALEEAQLGGPGRIVDGDHEQGAIEFHRLHMGGNGGADGFLPTPEQPPDSSDGGPR